MNIQDIKVAIATNAGIVITKLDLSTDPKEAVPEWASYWDNDKRVRIVAHMDIVAKLMEDPKMEGLSFKKEVRTPEDKDKASYTQYVIITPQHIVASF